MTLHSSRHAQISLEFIMVAGFAILLLVAMLAIALTQMRSAVTEGTLSGMEDVARTIQQELLTARSVGDGYTRVFSLPAAVQGRRYSITLTPDNQSSVVTIFLANREISVRTPRCDGTLSYGDNILRTSNGQITCEPVVS